MQKEQVKCPKCGELTNEFKQVGGLRFATCDHGCRVGLSKIPKEYIKHIPKKGENQEPKDTDHEEDHDTEGYQDPEHEEDTGPFPHLDSDEQILINLLQTYEISRKHQNIILTRHRNIGSLDPDELVDLLVALGNRREISTVLASDYSNMILKRQDQEESILRATGQYKRQVDIPDESEFDKILKIMKFSKEMNSPSQNGNNSEINELKNKLDSMSQELQNSKLDSIKSDFKHEMEIVNAKLDQSQGYHDDFYRIIAELGKYQLANVKEDKTKAIGSGIRVEGLIEAVNKIDSEKRGVFRKGHPQTEKSTYDLSKEFPNLPVEDLTSDGNHNNEDQRNENNEDKNGGNLKIISQGDIEEATTYAEEKPKIMDRESDQEGDINE